MAVFFFASAAMWADMIGRGPAAATDDVEETTAQEVFDLVAPWSGVSSYSPNWLGSPALGYALTKKGAFWASLRCAGIS